MKIKLNREQKIGLFALITLFSIYVVINYLKGKDLFSNRDTYYANFYNIDGLTATGPVFLRGLKIGSIESIDYISSRDNFLVKLKIQGEYKLPKNSVAEIYDIGVLGTKALRINLGNGGEYLNNKDTLQSATNPGIIDNLMNEIMPLKDKLANLIETLNTTFESVNQVLNPEARKEIESSVKNLNKTLYSARSVMANLDKSSPEITSVINNLNTLSGALNETAVKLNSGLDNFTEITDSLKKADLTGSINSLKELLITIQNPEGTIGKLLNTDSVHTSIDALVRDLDILVKSINENPKKYIKISVF
jgi:phospholipid/cholesterol/gamma-HCH transport system substrate-binding protein